MTSLAKASFSALLVCCLLSFMPKSLQAADQVHRPRWWLDNGICFVGNWEPLVFRVRRGPVPTNYRQRYEWEHSREAILGLKDRGVNMLLTHFYKGLGMDTEAQDLVWTSKLARICHENGMYVGAYIGSTMFNETLYRETPESADWVQLDLKGEPIHYSATQYFRDRVDLTLRGYREYMKSIVDRAIKEYDMDLIHFDNPSSMFVPEAGRSDHIRELFRRYLQNKYTDEQRRDLLGFADVSQVNPPPPEQSPMAPITDPLTQEWTVFRVESLTDYCREMSEHIRSVDPEVIVEFNFLGLGTANRSYANAVDYSRLLPYSDTFWSEDPDHARYYPDQNRLVSKIRSYKLARKFDNALFTYLNNPLEVAEAMAFNRMCLGDVGFRILEPWPEGVDMDDSYRYSYISQDTLTREKKAAISGYLLFFQEYKRFFRGLEEVVDVGVMRDFESLTFGGWQPHLATIQAEQALIQSRVPFTLLSDRDWNSLDRYKVVVLAAQENLEDKEIALLKSYVLSGGSLAVVGATGKFDQRRRERSVQDDFWKLLGAPQIAESPDRPARISLGAGKIFYLPRFQSHSSVPATASGVHPNYWHLPLNAEEFLEGLLWCRGGQYTVTVETRPHVAAAFYRQQRTRQVHLVNYWPGHPVRYIPVLFSEKNFKPARATLYSPGNQPLSLEVGQSGGNPLVLVPRLDTYAFLVLE